MDWREWQLLLGASEAVDSQWKKEAQQAKMLVFIGLVVALSSVMLYRHFNRPLNDSDTALLKQFDDL